MEERNVHNVLDEVSIITLQFSDIETKCAVLTIFEVDGGMYTALLPINGNKRGNEAILFYRYIINEDESITLEDIVEDEEYEWVMEEFNNIFDDQMCLDIINHFMGEDKKEEN